MAEVTRTIAAAGRRNRIETVGRIEPDLAKPDFRWLCEPAQKSS
jgi:hypothetical protein